jgi:O-antigen/teichoic acid export membrane protein
MRLVRSLFWNLVGSGIGRILSMPVGVVLARVMGREGYGELGIVYSSVELFSVFAGFGLGLTATKHTAEFRNTDVKRAGRIMALSMLISGATACGLGIILLVIAPWLASRFLAAPHLTNPLRISGLLMILSVMDGVQSACLEGFEAFRELARLRFIKGLLDLPLMLSGFWLFGINGVLWGAVLSRGSGFVLNRLELAAQARRGNISLSFRGCLKEAPVIWGFSTPALIAGALVGPVNWICSTMLINQPNGYSEMGMYNAASQWFNMVLFVPVAVGSGILPILSERLANKDTVSTKNVLKFLLKSHVLIVAPIALVISLLSPYIMLIYGTEYRHASLTLVAVIMTSAIVAVLTPVGQIIAASGRMWLGCLMNLGWAVVFILAAALLTPWGSLGLASARLIAYLCHSVWVVAFVIFVLRNRGGEWGGTANEY